jgi:hypothetical protein
MCKAQVWPFSGHGDTYSLNVLNFVFALYLLNRSSTIKTVWQKYICITITKGQDVKWLHTWFKRGNWLQTWQNSYRVMNIYNINAHVLSSGKCICMLFWNSLTCIFLKKQCLWHTRFKISAFWLLIFIHVVIENIIWLCTYFEIWQVTVQGDFFLFCKF